MSENLDLFGEPYVERVPKRGRPAHQRTIRNVSRIKMMLARGLSNERIADVIGVTVPTLRKYYFTELREREVMRDRLDDRRFEIAMEQANAGNVGAMRLLDQMLQRNDLMTAPTTRPDKAAPKLGKKEAAQIAAHQPDLGTPLGQLMAMRASEDGRPN